ncbi:[NiFe]-hydrogenase assembly chaperone HybE, partial [Paracoccus simplex]
GSCGISPSGERGTSALSRFVQQSPSGEYEFIHNSREMTGPYKACSLFSPMADFTSQLQAVDVARAVMVELFKPENRDGTDRAAEIRAAREAELAPPPEAASEAGPASDAPIPDPRPTRRALLTGGLAAAPAEGDDPEISGGVE